MWIISFIKEAKAHDHIRHNFADNINKKNLEKHLFYRPTWFAISSNYQSFPLQLIRCKEITN